MDLETAMQESKVAVHLFFNNKFDEAWEMLRPWVGSSVYHTVGNAVFHFLEAVLTLEVDSITKASAALKQSIQLCNFYRRRHTFSESFGKMVKKQNYDHYTPEAIHAELCYAESLLLKSMLTFIEDESLVNFLKGSLKIRSCYNSYKECANILHQRHWTDEAHKVHFESGVRMGIGAFNLMISLLPSRIIKLLEFIGFSGSKEVGLKELHMGYELKQGLRHVLSVMTLLSYHLIIVYFLGHSDGDLELCDQILKAQLKLYPEGAWFLYFKGRLELMKGNLSESCSWYIKSWNSQSVWPQFHHLCFWELMWAHSLALEWDQADVYATLLMKESKWSKTTYAYQKCSIQLMSHQVLPQETQDTIDSLMKKLPHWKKRVAGKSLPMEKFCIKKAERYWNQDRKLLLPMFELLYVWNMFKILGKKWKMIEAVYLIVDETIKQMDSGKLKISTTYEADNRGLLMLLKGGCLHQMNSPLQAEECLSNVLALEKKIKEDHYLVPYALVQLGIIHFHQGHNQKAIQILEDVKKNYTGYSLESRLHFQIHSALMELNSKEKKSSRDNIIESTRV
ncbi:tetratricopeptide repeat protein 39B-like isoform X2 [Macrosteles quadrilineatus]|nr:tetratricopeptide repeat protein 39B-like isoform X2 [Macrosteles quadrilineatus]